MKPRSERALASCEVATYWGDFAGDRAYLVSYRTMRKRKHMVLLRWESEYADSHDITGSFSSVQAAIERAKRDPRVRNIQF
jgi:hypothetical protein